MELRYWFKKSIKWWIGLAFIILGTVVMRQVGVIPYAQEVGGAMVFLGLGMVLFFGMRPMPPNQ